MYDSFDVHVLESSIYRRQPKTAQNGKNENENKMKIDILGSIGSLTVRAVRGVSPEAGP